VPTALRQLGYSEADIAEIRGLCGRHGTLSNARDHHSTLRAKGFDDEALQKSKRRCRPRSTSVRVQQVDAGEDILRDKLGVSAEVIASPSFDVLRTWVLEARDRGRECARLRRHDGRGRAAPAPEHYPVFDCAIRAAAPANAISRSRATSA